MVGLLVKLGVPLTLLSAVAYQIYLKDFVTVLGVFRTVQPISDFPAYQCRRIEDPMLQACEDMWLSERSRQLFLACSDPLSRKQWLPAMGNLNASGRALDDAIIAMNIDVPKHGREGEYTYRILEAPGELNLLGIKGHESAQGINFFLINVRPSTDPVTDELLDNKKVGANATVERFVLAPATSSDLRPIRTFANANISTPNNIAPLGLNAFYVTNDHGPHKTGLQSQLSPILDTGTVSYCTAASGCRIVASDLSFPNGLVRDPKDGYVYVPSATKGGITVYRPLEDASLEKVGFIDVPYPIDNLSQDADGIIWAAAIPQTLKTMKAFSNPLGPTPPSTVLRVWRKADGTGWEWEKVLEDGKGEILPGATTVIHDVKTGRLFFSGVLSPFIAVCERIAV